MPTSHYWLEGLSLSRQDGCGDEEPEEPELFAGDDSRRLLRGGGESDSTLLERRRGVDDSEEELLELDSLRSRLLRLGV